MLMAACPGGASVDQSSDAAVVGQVDLGEVDRIETVVDHLLVVPGVAKDVEGE